jgi:hypothetical protein
MKLFIILLFTTLSIHAAAIKIEGTQYRFEYDAGTWDFLPKSTETNGLWAFSDHLLFLGGGVIRLDSGSADGIVAKEMAQDTISADYDKVEEMKSIGGIKALKFSSSKDKKVRWLLYLAAAKYTLFIFVEGDGLQMRLRESTVRTFLGGIKRDVRIR